jgi:hypothetical protein
VGVEAQVGVGQAAGDQGVLGGADHAHGDVGRAAQQVLLLVVQRQLDRHAGMPGAEVGQDLGQHLGADDLAGGEADHAARGVAGPGRRADQGAGRPGHGLGVRGEVERGVGGLQALGRAGEQGHAQAALQFGDLATQGRLGQAQGPGGGRQAALGHHRQEGAVQAPVGIVHAFMHGRSRLFVNSRLAPVIDLAVITAGDRST